MYEMGNLDDYDGLGEVWGFAGKPEEVLVDPEAFIPKKRPQLTALQALELVRGGKVKKKKNGVKGDVYWRSGKAIFSEKPVKGGEKAEPVPPPKKKHRPKVRIVRDLPKVKFTPVKEGTAPAPPAPLAPPPKEKSMKGFGEKSLSQNNTVSLVVLGLIILIALGYNIF